MSLNLSIIIKPVIVFVSIVFLFLLTVIPKDHSKFLHCNFFSFFHFRCFTFIHYSNYFINLIIHLQIPSLTFLFLLLNFKFVLKVFINVGKLEEFFLMIIVKIVWRAKLYEKDDFHIYKLGKLIHFYNKLVLHKHNLNTPLNEGLLNYIIYTQN